MEYIATLIIVIFVFAIIIEISKFIFKLIIYFFQIAVVLILAASIFTSSLYSSKDNNYRVNEICNRIDGCPVVDGICIGCE